MHSVKEVGVLFHTFRCVTGSIDSSSSHEIFNIKRNTVLTSCCPVQNRLWEVSLAVAPPSKPSE